MAKRSRIEHLRHAAKRVQAAAKQSAERHGPRARALGGAAVRRAREIGVAAMGALSGVGRRLAARLKAPVTPRAALGLASTGLSVGGLAAAALYLIFAPQLPEDVDLWNANRKPSITLLDRTGERMASRGALYGEATAVDELPDHLVAAFLATEDRRFFDHAGVDLRGTLRALVVNLRAGALREGGSTITQQLAKNLFLSADKTFQRKLKEAFIALWIEGRYEKTEILSLYLNRIYLGAGAYGVDAASRRYFSKPAKEAGLAEAAMLAGLPKAPSAYAPSAHLARAEARALEVLDDMVAYGALDTIAALEAKLAPAAPTPPDEDEELGYFFDYAAAEAVRLAPSGAKDLVVRTTLDAALQRLAEDAVTTVMDKRGEALDAGQAAFVAMDASGAIRAMVGGRAYADSQFNRAVQADRQPGSAFKLFLYLTALEQGLTPETTFIDGPVEVAGWRPENYDEDFLGEVRMTDAVARSINTVAVQVAERVGRDNVIATARRLGVTSPLANHPSLALGASEVNLLELTAAFARLAARGYAVDAHAIDAITDGADDVLFERTPPERKRVIARKTVTSMNHLLFQVLHDGTGRKASLSNRPAAGKTGTSQDWRDAWFVGYTPDLIAGVWVGNDDHSPMNEVTGGDLPAEIWRLFMIVAHQGRPVRDLPGAYPAVDVEAEEALRRYYAEMEGAFMRVERQGLKRPNRVLEFFGLD
ncbi:MAG: PBP1A family penicillin-binding protein [Pseudomonadota bacterium]